MERNIIGLLIALLIVFAFIELMLFLYRNTRPKGAAGGKLPKRIVTPSPKPRAQKRTGKLTAIPPVPDMPITETDPHARFMRPGTQLPDAQYVAANSAGDAKSFIHEVAQLFNALSSAKAVISTTGSAGADIRLYAPNGKLVGIIQCFHFKENTTIEQGVIRGVAALKTQVGVSNAVIATTAYFAPAAKQEAAERGIRLVDGTAIQKMRKRALSKSITMANSVNIDRR